MQVDVADVLRLQSRHLQGRLHGRLGASPFGMRRRHVVCVTGFTIAGQQDAAGGKRLRIIRQALHQRKSGCLANG